MGLTAKQKKMLSIGGIVWKILSAVALIFLFVITTSGDIAANNALEKENINNNTTWISKTEPKIVEIEKELIKDAEILHGMLKYFDENRAMLHGFQTMLMTQSISIVELQSQLKTSAENQDRFWKKDWTELQFRLNRIEDKLDGIK